MKRLLMATVAGMVLLLSACIKDSYTSKFTFYRPVYKTKAEVRTAVKSGAPVDIAAAGKLFYKDGYVFLNELDKGVHIIDISNPAAPKNVSFITIPGCVDLAVRNQYLYADMATDMVVIDISQPTNVKLVNVLEGVFAYRAYDYWRPDTGMVITDWVRVDTVVESGEHFSWGLKAEDMAGFGNFNSSGRATISGSNGIGGSLARFALAGNRMYTVSFSDIKVFNTTVSSLPTYVKQVDVGAWDIETIFPYKQHLFLGSMSGMYIYDISQPDAPVQKSKFEHARVCDPVVADDLHAYVTLRNGTQCQGFINQLDIVDIANITSPRLVKSYPMTNPHGLSVDGQLLLIADGRDGLRLIDVSNKAAVRNISLLAGFNAYDVIALNGLALVSAADGLYLVDYSTPTAPKLLNRLLY